MTVPYILPSSTTPVSGKLTLTQFIQTVMVGVSGLPGPLVRPKWQPEAPKQPDILTNWMAIGIDVASPDANAWLGVNSDTTSQMQRHELLDISCSIYGPEALETYRLIRDGFQVPQNREALFHANMGFVEISPGRKIPDLVHERWVNRIETNVFLQREIQRVYSVPTLQSAEGVIHTVLGGEDYLLDWTTQNVET